MCVPLFSEAAGNEENQDERRRTAVAVVDNVKGSNPFHLACRSCLVLCRRALPRADLGRPFWKLQLFERET